MPRNYMRDYGGPIVPRAAVENKPDWAALFPIPESKQAGAEAFRAEHDDNSGFWLSPRMAFMLYGACTWLASDWSDWPVPACQHDVCDSDHDYIDQVPAVAHPYFDDEVSFQEAFGEAALRMAARLAKGMPPSPNCTGEEMALHWGIKIAKARLADLDCYVSMEEDSEDSEDSEDPEDPEISMAEDLEAIPASTEDEAFDKVSRYAFKDHDVLLLFNKPGIVRAHKSTLQMQGCINLHPNDWFKPFDAERVDDHMP